MKISAVNVTAFRSIDHAEIDECGELNVLIGRNNSGKSNLLSAIQLFFEFLRSASLAATANPPISEVTDWFDRRENVPVKINMSLDMTTSEISGIRTAIASEAPQMRNALEDRDDIIGIECELTFYRLPMPLGFLSRISFLNSGEGTPGRHIFGLERAAANEIAARDREINEIHKHISVLSQIDSDDWASIRERRTAPLQALLPRSIYAGLSGDSRAAVNRLIKSSTSSEDFQERLSAQTGELQDRAATLLSVQNETKFETFSGESTILPDYVTNIVTLIGQLKVHHLSEQRQPIGPDEANRILRLKTSRGRGHVLQEIQERVAELLGVKIDAFSSDRQASRLSPTSMAAELDVDDFLVQVNGSGIREALRLILDYEFERPDVLLVEEPEVHLHPALEIAMMQYLRQISSGCQVFLTTHSTNFLDIADLRNVYLVKKDPSTIVQLLDVEEAEEAIPQELGIRLSSLFMYDRLVFVEGPSDEQVFRTFASTLGLNLSRAGVGFVTTGGARNFTHYANAATLSFLSKRRVKLFFILDRDERDLPEIEKLQGKLGELGELKVLGRRELENYLIQASALSRYISQKVSHRNDCRPSDITELVDKISSEMLEVAIERRVLKLACKPIIPNRDAVIGRGEKDFGSALTEQLSETELRISSLKKSIASLLDETREALEGKSAKDRLALIPGDVLLGALFERYGLTFNKRKDGPKIAIIMTKAEVPSEIGSILREVTDS